MYLREKRIEANISQNEAALLLGICASTLCQYEKGKREPSIALLVALSDLYHCTIDELVRGEEK